MRWSISPSAKASRTSSSDNRLARGGACCSGSIVDRFLREVRNATVQVVPVGRLAETPPMTRPRNDDDAPNQLFLGYGGFLLALVVLGGWSAQTLREMSTVSLRIISENYDSVVAAQDMKESLERQDSSALFDLLGQRERARQQAADHRVRFDAALRRPPPTSPSQARPSIRSISAGRDEYYRLFDAFLRVWRERNRLYFETLEPRFNAVRADCASPAAEPGGHAPQSRLASATARRWFGLTLLLGLALMVVGIAVEVSLTRSILGPFGS